ncbi:hypothetical protein BDW75DRAFT_27968 [Aspergillus navahoensis]
MGIDMADGLLIPWWAVSWAGLFTVSCFAIERSPNRCMNDYIVCPLLEEVCSDSPPELALLIYCQAIYVVIPRRLLVKGYCNSLCRGSLQAREAYRPDSGAYSGLSLLLVVSFYVTPIVNQPMRKASQG